MSQDLKPLHKCFKEMWVERQIYEKRKSGRAMPAKIMVDFLQAAFLVIGRGQRWLLRLAKYRGPKMIVDNYRFLIFL